jgi:WD40 repeat protein/tetratricopeptide (TPR) repeat protein
MDTPTRLTLRIFVSSPGDVTMERNRAADVVARLQEEFLHYAVFEPFFWEDQPARATDTFQSQFPEASGMDIVVGILWARIGTPLPLDKVRPDGRRYESGTVYELETAAESYRARGTPDLVVYRKTSDPPLPLHDEAEQRRRLDQLAALEAFIRRWFFHGDDSFKAAFHTFKTPDQFEQQLETHLRKLIREKVERAERPGRPGEGEIVFHGIPYPGLKAFGLEDAPVFYGRARALAAVREALRAQAGRDCAFLLIFGMSGSGKSSLVRAGLVHALTAIPGWIPEVNLWRCCVVRPGDATGDPLDALVQAFFGDTALPELRGSGLDAARLARTLRDNPDDLDLIVGPALRAVAAAERERRAADRPLTARLLVVVDQMEELFTREWLDEPARTRYVAALSALARSGLAWVVATMRSEFFARCGELPELVALKAGQGQLDLLPPSFAEVGQMIRYPARDAALRWGKDPDQPGQALDDLLQEAAWRDPKALPLLQFTLNELFRRREGRTLTCAAYRALGGMEGALANHAEATLAALPPKVQAALPALLRTLVTIGEGDREPVVSRRVPLEPLRIDPIRRWLLDVLIDARLLLTDRDDRMQPVAGIAHEALLTHWPRLMEMLDKDRDFLRARTRAAAAAEHWRRESRHDDFLLHEGRPLAEATELLKTRRDDLEPETIEFIDRSVRCQARQRRRRHRVAIALALTILLTALFGTAAALTTLAMIRIEGERRNTEIARQKADKARGDAESARNEANAAREGEANAKKELRLRLVQNVDVANGFQAIDRGDTFGSLAWFADALRLELGDPGREETHRIRLATTLRQCPKVTQILFHDGPVSEVVFSPDGSRVLTASEDGTARVWDAATGQPLAPPMKHEKRVFHAEFSSDGRRVLTASEDGTARVWDAATGHPTIMLNHASVVRHASFSPDGRRVLTGCGDATARVWDVATGKTITQPMRHEHWVNYVEFSPDGRRALTASYDRTARVWDASTGQPLTPPMRFEGWVCHAEFSPDGRSVLTASADNSARVWDAATGQPLTPPMRHENGLVHAEFSPDGRRIVTASSFIYGRSGAARVWDTATGQPLTPPMRHEESVAHAAFSPDGRRIVTATGVMFGRSGAAQVWDASTGQPLTPPLKHEGPVEHAAFSPDSRRVLTASFDKTARIWDLAVGQLISQPLKHDEKLMDAAFSSDGKRVVTASQGGTARVWDAATGQPLTPPLRHENYVGHAEFSPDGRRVLTTSGSSSARVWDAATGQPLTPPMRHKAYGGADHAAFSPDGRRIVTAGTLLSGRVKDAAWVWDVASGQTLTPPMNHEDTVNLAAFSPDGRRVLTASRDKTARVWDVSTGQLIITLNYEGVTDASFSPDGRRVLTLSEDGRARVWDASTGQPIIKLNTGDGLVDASFSPDGRRIVTATRAMDEDRSGAAQVWDASTGQPLTPPLKHKASPGSAAFSPDGKRVVTAGDGLRLWDASTGQPLTPPMRLKGMIRYSFSPDGRRVLAAGEDMRVGGWDVSSDAREAADLIRLAHFRGGSRIDQSGVLVALTLEEFRAAWGALREKYPEDFVTSDGEILAWHRREADDCEEKKVWESGIWHFDRLIASAPAHGGLFARRARAYAQLGRWEEAAVDFSRAIDLEPSEGAHRIDRGDVNAESGRWDRASADYAKAVELETWDNPKREAQKRLAIVKLAMTDVGAYRRACADLLRDSGETSHGGVANGLAWTCVLAPNAVADWEAVVRLALTAVKAPKLEYDRHNFLNTLGAAAYRAGRHEEAIRHLDEGIKAQGKGGDPTDWLFLAQANQRVGHAAEARRWLDKAVHWIDSSTKDKPKDDSLGTRIDWRDWLTLQVLRREAEAMVKVSKVDAPPGRP